ncbi:MAG TPA: hypothetical protein VFK05_01100 [Polyangiaceae bacterium]|nr:hypothetical protein [Polyangiaceae bacterium]
MIRGPLVFALAGLAVACSPEVYGRVVSDVRIANGFISIDRCLLKQASYHRVAVRDCHTENYYIGQTVVPKQTSVNQSSEYP